MGYDNNDKKGESVYSKRIRAGKRRTYFFDVRTTRGNDYYLTITESRKRFNDDGYDRHKVFLYKEDFNKFVKGLNEAVDYVKTELMPDFDFDAFSHDTPYDGEGGEQGDQDGMMPEPPAAAPAAPAPVMHEAPAQPAPAAAADNGATEEVDKW